MTEYFSYNTTEKVDPMMTVQPPLASSQETFNKMVEAKRVNDGTYWTKMREVFAEDFANHEIEYTDIPFMLWDGGAKYLSIK